MIGSPGANSLADLSNNKPSPHTMPRLAQGQRAAGGERGWSRLRALGSDSEAPRQVRCLGCCIKSPLDGRIVAPTAIRRATAWRDGKRSGEKLEDSDSQRQTASDRTSCRGDDKRRSSCARSDRRQVAGGTSLERVLSAVGGEPSNTSVGHVPGDGTGWPERRPGCWNSVRGPARGGI